MKLLRQNWLDAFLAAYPGPSPAAPAPGAAPPVPGRMLSAALRDRSVQLGAAMLALYVGLELSVGNWGFSSWCRPGLCHTRWPATRSAGTGSG